MPEIGGKRVASNVRIGLLGLKKRLAALDDNTASALNELDSAITEGEQGVKQVLAEAAEVRSAFSEITGNGESSDGN